MDLRAPKRLARRGLLVLAALLAGLGSAAAQAPRPSAGPARDFGGIYASTLPLLDARRLLPDGIYRNPAAAGVYIRLVWSVVEPRRGQYDFTLLDRELDRAVAAGKRVSLSVIAGGHAPAWLAAEGIPTLRFDIGRGGANRACITTEMGVPWDAGYQAAFAELWTALARHIRARPGAWEALRIVKLTGMNRITEELRIPADTGRRNDVCGQQDEAARWLSVGYTPQRAVEAWTRLAEGIATAFPEQLLSLDVLERNDFPPIGDDGRPVADSPVKARIIAEGRRRFGPRFAVQWNGLTAEGPLAEAVLAAHRQGSPIGWQSNAFRGAEGAGCNAARNAQAEPCDEARFAAILRRGTGTGAAFLEIWAPDILRFPAAVRAADATLRAEGRAR
jgi:hypothetical protein